MKKRRSSRKTVSLSLDGDIVEIMKYRARTQNMTFSRVVEEVLENDIEEDFREVAQREVNKELDLRLSEFEKRLQIQFFDRIAELVVKLTLHQLAERWEMFYLLISQYGEEQAKRIVDTCWSKAIEQMRKRDDIQSLLEKMVKK